MSQEQQEKCVGCENIKNSNFPFNDRKDENNKVTHLIDSEGCGPIQDDEEYYLRISFCPVCGKKL